MHTRGREGGRFPFEIPEQRCAQRARTNRFASLQRSHAFHHVLRRSLSRQVPVNSRTHCKNSPSSPVTPIRRIRTLGAVVRTLRTAVRSSFLLPRDDRSRMSVSSPSRSSVRKGSAVSVPTTSISSLLTSIRESASLSRRFSAATKTRGFCLAVVPSFARAALSPATIFVRRSPFELIFFLGCSAACKIWRVPAFIVGHPPCVSALMLVP